MTVIESPDRAEQLAAVFRSQRGRLWGLAYRLTGSAEDADDVVQETFVRLVECRLPVQPGPWLVRVATNLGIDALRRRRRRRYVGPWLPSPIDTSVYAPDLSREAILDGLRARRCFGSTAAKIFLDVRVDGHLMGEKITKPAGAKVTVEVKADCPADIDRIEVCRNNKFIHSKPGDGRQGQFTFVDQQPLPGRSYYYVRVMQKDGEIAWSSPVWFGAQ